MSCSSSSRFCGLVCSFVIEVFPDLTRLLFMDTGTLLLDLKFLLHSAVDLCPTVPLEMSALKTDVKWPCCPVSLLAVKKIIHDLSIAPYGRGIDHQQSHDITKTI